MILRAPSTAGWMLPPPEQEPGEFEQRWNVAPDRQMPIGEMFARGGMPGMEQYGEADAPSVYGAHDKQARENERRAKILGSLMPGQTQAEAGRPSPHSGARDRAMMELGRDLLVPQTPLDAGLMVAGGPVGGKLLRGGAAALGALFEPDEAEAGLIGKAGKVLGGKPGGPHSGGIHVYHSSPHDFDRFDWSKLRTGEGANTYGAGFYFAENPKVSGQGGQYWDQFARRFQGTPELEAAQILRNNKFDRATAIEEVKGLVKHYDDKHSRDILKLLESGAPVGPRTYEVNINARPELLLDWDKPMTQQDPAVRALAARVGMDPRDYDVTKGAALYRRAGDYFGPKMNTSDFDKAASEGMRDYGIPGIRYLDQGSRLAVNPNITGAAQRNLDMAQQELAMAKQSSDQAWIARQQEKLAKAEAAMNPQPPSYNYVVTDPGKLDILAKYGVVGGVPLGALAAQDRYQQ